MDAKEQEDAAHAVEDDDEEEVRWQRRYANE
jgi:hypothetical protein